jgi:hypothetical protein
VRVIEHSKGIVLDIAKDAINNGYAEVVL